jgi:hypothetical protein
MALAATTALLGLAVGFTADTALLQSIVVAQAASTQPQSRELSAQNIDDLFRDFTADWVRNDADLATRTRYLTGAEQDRLESKEARKKEPTEIALDSAPAHIIPIDTVIGVKGI